MNAVAETEEKTACTQAVGEERQYVLPRVNIVESKDGDTSWKPKCPEWPKRDWRSAWKGTN